ncbi:MAG: PQQ-binding-like beta-propeller repeat protein [Rubripirellula sp.]
MPLLRFVIAIVFLHVLAVTGFADWSTYLNGNDRAGYSPTELEFPLKLVWQHKTSAKPQMAWEGPRNAPIEGHEMRHRVDFDDAMQTVISDGRVYFGSTVDHRLYCVKSTTGEVLWTHYTEGAIRLAPTLAHGNIYFGSDDGKVYCLNAVTGRPVWVMRVGPEDDRLLSRGEMISRWPVRTGVLIDGETAYFGAGVFPHEMIYLCAVNALSGDVIWRNDTISEQNAGRNDLTPQGYLLSNKDNLFVPSGRSLPVAVSKQDGTIVFQEKYSWRTDAGGVVGGTKALLGDGQVYAGGPHHFLAMDQRNGDVGEAYINGRQMALANDQAFILTGEKLICVDHAKHSKASQEKQKWFLKARSARSEPAKLAEAKQKMLEFAQIGVLWEFPTTFDDVLIATQNVVVAGGLNELIALDRKSGKLLWTQKVVGNVRGLAVDDGVLTVSTDEGHIYAFLSEAKLPAEVASSPTREWPVAYGKPYEELKDQDRFRKAAAEILKRSGQATGFCLVLGSEEGRLAYELAVQSDLNVIGVEPDPSKAAKSRALLEAAGMHGASVTIVNAPLTDIPFSNYFANLIVSDTVLQNREMGCAPEDVSRFLKPCGGVAMLGCPDSQSGGEFENAVSQWLTDLFHQDEGEMISASPWYMLRRGKLPGAGSWSHQYGNVANTSFAADHRIRDGLGVLWYGDPGPSSMLNRHEAAGAPLSTNGRMFIQGTDKIMAYDAYNGTFLWEYKNPGAIRTGVFNNRETHNLAASDDHLYAAAGKTCVAIDATSGKVIAEYTTPESSDGIERAWAYLAYDNGQLFGTSTIRGELEARLRRRGLKVKSQTDAVFAVDTETGKRVWTYRGDNILHTTIAVGPEHVYFIDSSMSPEDRQQLYLQDKDEFKKLTGDAALKAEAEMKKLDLRLAVAIDRKTGEKVWSKAVDVTDTTNVSAGGGSLTLMYANGHVVLCGANANGHYWKQFLSGQFDQRKIVVLDSSDGNQLWAKNANYMNRPAVIGDEVYAEPWAFNLHTGQPKTSSHPLTGEETQWRFSRPGHHCGVITATPNMMFFRSGFIGYYDLYNDSGTRHFAGQRLGCWINAIPGNGLVMIPEASAGCVCQFSIASTVVMEPKTENKSWGIFSAVGASTPVKRMGINLGAPGDRKDDSGREWFGYPRPSSRGRLEFVFNLKHKLESGGKWYSRNAEAIDLGATQTPWLYTSGTSGLKSVDIPLRGKEDGAANYTVKIYLGSLQQKSIKPVASGPFDLSFQGNVVAEAISFEPSQGTGSNRVLVKEFKGVPVETSLKIDLKHLDAENPGSIAAIEVIQE